jgi:hypothetical protein
MIETKWSRFDFVPVSCKQGFRCCHAIMNNLSSISLNSLAAVKATMYTILNIFLNKVLHIYIIIYI